MDEASSRFVDRIAVERLLAEKLGRVSHRPTVPFVSGAPATPPAPAERPPLHAYPAERARGTVLFVHGLFEEQREIYGFLFSGLRRRGYSVELCCLPYHYERKPEGSLFSGELFFSADLARTREAFLLALQEVGACLEHLRRTRRHPVFLAGFSMGAAIALLLTAARRSVEGVCVINPPADFPSLIWRSPLCRTIRADLERAGAGRGDVAAAFRDIDPLHVRDETVDVRRVLMIQALYDLITEQDQYDALAEAWGLRHRARYAAGHLNTLRVPRLADDIAGFFDGLHPTAAGPAFAEGT